MTASEDELAAPVRVTGAAACRLLPPHSPSACLLVSPLPACPSSSSPSPSFPSLPASLYVSDVGLGAAVLGNGIFSFSSWILLLLEQKAQHLPLQPGERREGSGGKQDALHPCLPPPAGSFLRHFDRNAFELLPDSLVYHTNGVLLPAVINCTVCSSRKEWSC